ncbi:hypothetical protein C3941_16380 [Kaistia algarum]|uniref:hypothetical protein n=1 Tax=Kaistia algarum TaxID=2083279 RepID=UPI000CE84318|nr:hypothetical protein [Kaistia algarum]MCX5514607.1 hypothetical protein [Kaistia algarum]PPE78951.1 hypothetical protein C3941_16380 [Kaistia algarum]
MSIYPADNSDVRDDIVHVVWSYHDGPREGIAEFRGWPHVYKCRFSEVTDDWTDVFWLMKIEPSLLKLAEEQFAIFRRWKNQHELGSVSIDSHPALPTDRARYDELRSVIGDGLQLQPEHSITRRAHFSLGGAPNGLTVRWTSL